MALPSRKLGSTGLEVSALGLGGAWLGAPASEVTDDQAVGTVRYAIDHGINYLDTSPAYLESERRIGLALTDGYRDRVVLATKTGTRAERYRDYSGDATRQSIDTSLRLLQTDRLEVALVHDPPDAASVFARGAVLDTLEALREEGLLKVIGIGVRKHDILLQCIRSARVDLILTYLDYTLLSQTAMSQVIPEAAERGVAVVNGSPLAMGLLTGENPRTRKQSEWQPRRVPEEELERSCVLWRWAQARNIPLAALALRYSIANPDVSVTLNGACSPLEIAHSIRCATTRLPADVWQEMASECGVPPPPQRGNARPDGLRENDPG